MTIFNNILVPLILILTTFTYGYTDSSMEFSSNLFSIVLSGITLLGLLAVYLKKLVTQSDIEKKLENATNDLANIRLMVKTYQSEIKDITSEFNKKLAEKASIDTYEIVLNNQEDLETVVNEQIDKLNTFVHDLSRIEQKLNDVKKNIDDTNARHKEEIKEINENIKILRENVREDINDVKDVLMKLMMTLRVKD